jgi:hypothetical protein
VEDVSSKFIFSLKLCLIDKLLVFRTPVGAENDFTSFLRGIERSCGSEGFDFIVFTDGRIVCP